jgi:hypothetical protein
MPDRQRLSVYTKKDSTPGKTGLLLSMDNKVFPGEILTHHMKKLLAMKDSKDYIGITACGVLHNRFVIMKWHHYNTPKEGIRLNEYRCTESKYLLYEHHLTS